MIIIGWRTVGTIGTAFIVTKILILSMSWAVYLLGVFVCLSSGWWVEEKSIKNEGEMDVGCNIMAPPCIIPQFYDKYLNENPRKVDGSPYLIKPL